MHPRVSFVMTSHNYAQYVAQAIDSLLDQTFQDLELIVVDDRSSDGSRGVLERYRGDPRVRLFFNADNRGHIPALNQALELARGEYVANMDSDDYSCNLDAVTAQVGVLDANPSVGFVYSAYDLVDESGHRFREFRPWQRGRVRNGLDEFGDLVFRNYIAHSGTMIRKSLLDSVGYFDPTLPHAADWDLWLRIAGRSRVAYLATPLYAYRVHRDSMTIALHSPRQINSEFLRTVHKAFAKLPESAPESIRQLEPLAIQQVLLNATWADRSHGRTLRAWIGLINAWWHAPDLLYTRKFHSAFARLALLSLIGFPAYERLARLARAQRSAAPWYTAISLSTIRSTENSSTTRA